MQTTPLIRCVLSRVDTHGQPAAMQCATSSHPDAFLSNTQILTAKNKQLAANPNDQDRKLQVRPLPRQQGRLPG